MDPGNHTFPDDSPPTTAARRWDALSAGLIVLAAGLVYANTLTAPFHFDDMSQIVGNRVVTGEFSLSAIWWHSPRRFLTFLSFALNHRVGGLDVRGFHVVNVLLHMANALLVWQLCRMTLRTPGADAAMPRPCSRWLPLSAGLIFAVHPVQTQAVTYIVQRATLLATFFYLGALLLYGHGRLARLGGGSPRAYPRRLYAYALVSVAGGMYCKEIVATFPAAIFLYEWCFFPADRRRAWLRALPFAAVVLVTVLSTVVRPAELLNPAPLAAMSERAGGLTADVPWLSRWDYLLTQPRVLVVYLGLLLLPVSQNLDYDFRVSTSWAEPQVLGSVLLLALLTAWAVTRYRHRQPLLAFPVFWFFVTLAVESSVIPIRDVIFEHRLYLPMVGYAVLLPAVVLTITCSGRTPPADGVPGQPT